MNASKVDFMNAHKVDFKTYNLITSCLAMIATGKGEVWRAQTYDTEYPTSRTGHSC